MKRINKYVYLNKTKKLNIDDIGGHNEQNVGKNPISTSHLEETGKYM